MRLCKREGCRYINDTVRVCDSSGEDPTCQDSLKVKQLRHLDHGSYFNMSIECNPMFTPVMRAQRARPSQAAAEAAFDK